MTTTFTKTEPMRDEYKSLSPKPKFPIVTADTTFHELSDQSYFYKPDHPDFAFADSQSEYYRRVGNVVATVQLSAIRFTLEGTLYVSNFGAYVLIEQHGLIVSSGSCGAIDVRTVFENDIQESPSQSTTHKKKRRSHLSCSERFNGIIS